MAQTHPALRGQVPPLRALAQVPQAERACTAVHGVGTAQHQILVGTHSTHPASPHPSSAPPAPPGPPTPPAAQTPNGASRAAARPARARPESPPFIKKGDAVDPGQTLCIVEAMKLMNEIQAEKKCRVVDILVDDGESVEYGQPLVIIEPL